MIHEGYIPSTVEELKVVEEAQGGLFFSDFAGDLLYPEGTKLVLPYKSVLEFAPKAFEDDPQQTGDCTSHGSRNASDISRATEIVVAGEPEAFIARGATEGIYGYRGHSGQGMSPALATQFLVKYGILIRQKYPFADLSTYNPEFGIKMGGRGPSAEVLAEAKKHPCRYSARLRTLEEVKIALANGYGIHCGSQYGNNKVRDKHGISRWTATWNHDMAWGGWDEDSTDDLLILVLNSWGIYNKGGHPPWGPIPGGSFLITSQDAERMLRTGEVWAVGNVHGFPAQDLPNYGTGDYL